MPTAPKAVSTVLHEDACFSIGRHLSVITLCRVHTWLSVQPALDAIYREGLIAHSATNCIQLLCCILQLALIVDLLEDLTAPCLPVPQLCEEFL